MRGYLQMLIWMMLFVIIIEMIFPDSAYRKYIKLILGCILIYTMLQPIIGLVKGGHNSYDDYVKYYEARLSGGETALLEYNNQLESQQQVLKRYYEEGIRSTVEKEFDVKVQAISLSYEGNELEEITLTVGKNRSGKIHIGTIHIGNKSDTLDGDEENLKNKIKTCLSDFYNVQVCNIHITVQKN
ncbi:stage III sporulation protein AF [Cellulosilyticum sp. ST5]|uniref:stage III sporulation protein AF n=1 Tax=unclassified Cellulosilyticum TaxID=2643091 RepID=UPI000F8EAD98|nr:stage III sporulation protein AF [Cellulosilyticum sp. WCF-2]QEH68916.1 hypothetical protein EKH84_11180 [Cellulosilyticum sp. WCF-2]